MTMDPTRMGNGIVDDMIADGVVFTVAQETATRLSMIALSEAVIAEIEAYYSGTGGVIGTANEITVDAGTGAVGIADNPIIPGTGAMIVPVGTIAQRPTGAVGMLRWSTDSGGLSGEFESWDPEESNWAAVVTGGNYAGVMGAYIDSVAFSKAPLTTKGDIAVYKGAGGSPAASGPARLPIGTDGHSLVADSTLPHGMKWVSLPTLSDGDKGDITVSASGATWTIDLDAVTYGKMQNVVTNQRVLGRTSGAGGDVEELAATTVLDWLGSTRGTLLYRGAAGWAALVPVAAGRLLQDNGVGADPSWVAPGVYVTDGDKGDITVSATGATWTIDAGVVTLAKMADMATASLLGRNTAGTGSPEVLSAATARTLLSLVVGTNVQAWSANLDTVAAATWAKGVILVGTGAGTLTALAVGANDTSPIADSSQASGVRWGTTPWKTTAGVTSNSPGTLATDDFVFGSATLDYGAEASRMFFDKSQKAFRAGSATAPYWDVANIGLYSTGFGFRTKASGRSSVSFGEYGTSSGRASLTMGFACNATAGYAAAWGYKSTASGAYSTAIGVYTTATARAALAIGEGCDATAAAAVAVGFNTNANHAGEFAFGYNKLPAGSTGHASSVTWMAQTTTATPAELFLNGSTATLRFAVPVSVSYTFSILVIARRFGSIETGGWKFEGVIKNDAGTTSIVGTVTKLVLGKDAAAWDVAVTADNTNDAILITVTGEAAKTINWVANGHFALVTG